MPAPPADPASTPALSADWAASPGRRSGAAAWRLAELTDGPARVAARVAAALGIPLGAATAIERVDLEPPIGVLPQPDGRAAVGAMVPLGRLTAAQVTLLARADRLVLTPWRGVVLPGLSPPAAAEWAAALAEAGLPVEAKSRWAGVTACAGRPGCAKSLADVRAEADAATTRFVEGRPVHWIGCARGCGSPAGSHVRVEATPAGWTVDDAPTETGWAPDGAPTETGRTADGAPTEVGWTVDGVPAEGDRLAEIVAEARRR